MHRINPTCNKIRDLTPYIRESLNDGLRTTELGFVILENRLATLSTLSESAVVDGMQLRPLSIVIRSTSSINVYDKFPYDLHFVDSTFSSYISMLLPITYNSRAIILHTLSSCIGFWKLFDFLYK